MYQNDHGPAHFHVRNRGHEAKIALATLEIEEGSLPRSVYRQVRLWARVRESELQRAWQQVSAYEHPDKIAPLE